MKYEAGNVVRVEEATIASYYHVFMSRAAPDYPDPFRVYVPVVINGKRVHNEYMLAVDCSAEDAKDLTRILSKYVPETWSEALPKQEI